MIKIPTPDEMYKDIYGKNLLDYINKEHDKLTNISVEYIKNNSQVDDLKMFLSFLDILVDGKNISAVEYMFTHYAALGYLSVWKKKMEKNND